MYIYIYCFPKIIWCVKFQEDTPRLRFAKQLVTLKHATDVKKLGIVDLRGSTINPEIHHHRYGGVLSHGGTPSYHPFLAGIFEYKPTSYKGVFHFRKPPDLWIINQSRRGFQLS